MSKRIVVALGGNALGQSLSEQKAAVVNTASTIVDLIAAGHNVIVAHGNGPQVGMIYNAMSALCHEDAKQEAVPLYVCGAMSQAYIGLDLQNAIREELKKRGIAKPVCTIVTEVVVDAQDKAFEHPTKPIGKFLTKEEADAVAAKTGYLMKEDAGRGYRRYVPSPLPKDIIEIDTIRTLNDNGNVVIACGGGGVPVVRDETTGSVSGIDCVIDKDFASELLAEKLDADMLIILTAVEQVAINFRKENETHLAELTPAMAAQYIEEGQFAPGSMLPKVQAAVKFCESKKDREALITLLEKAADGVAGKTGTRVHQ